MATGYKVLKVERNTEKDVALKVLIKKTIKNQTEGIELAKTITIYTSSTCAYCPMVKKYLSMKGKDYSEVNIEDDPASRQHMMNLTGQMTVPVTVVTSDDGSQDVTVGYNLGKLSAAIA